MTPLPYEMLQKGIQVKIHPKLLKSPKKKKMTALVGKAVEDDTQQYTA